MSNFSKYIDQIGRKHGRGRAFSDFLTMAVCCLSMQEKEDEYFKAIKPYDKEELNLFCKAFAEIIMEMDKKPFSDCLGDYYMEYLANKGNGQFFTPPSVCDLMAQLTPPKPFTAINDPCCGSGRFFLSTAKLEKHNFYYGADVDYQCCQMAIINLCLNGLFGFISHMNTLSLKEWHRWEVKPHPKHKINYIHELTINSNYGSLYDVAVEEIVNTPPRDVVVQDEKSTTKNQQLNLFLNQIDNLL